MNIKKTIKENPIIVLLRTILQQIIEGVNVAKHVTDGNMSKDLMKLQVDMSIQLHALEKGMSIGNGKVGFGKVKTLSLIDNIYLLNKLGGDKRFINDACATINDYIRYNEGAGADMLDIKEKMVSLEDELFVKSKADNGIISLIAEQIIKDSKSDFCLFSQSRHSVRDFSSKKIDLRLIHEALKLAERTPSACNRQSWKLHVYTENDIKDQVFKLQGGSKGFYDSMQCAILVNVDLRYYNISELNLAYVDGGLYAMNLMYALHYYGLATIPLTMGLKQGFINNMRHKLHIASNEALVLLIGVGTYKENFKVAASHRRQYQEYTHFNS